VKKLKKKKILLAFCSILALSMLTSAGFAGAELGYPASAPDFVDVELSRTIVYGCWSAETNNYDVQAVETWDWNNVDYTYKTTAEFITIFDRDYTMNMYVIPDPTTIGEDQVYVFLQYEAGYVCEPSIGLSRRS
jgi:hypothetical protein